jgi:hypothetical protein
MKPALVQRVFILTLLLFSRTVAWQGAKPPVDAPATVWSGIYSPNQAKRGATAYTTECSRCHRDDLSGYGGLRGTKFIDNWREDSLESLWLRLSKTMPVGAPGTLSETQYLDILAFILEANEFPSGERDLTVSRIAGIRFQDKAGAQPVPDFALIETVGCLSVDDKGIWRVTHSTEPVRTRNPHASTAEEQTEPSSNPAGDKTFQFLPGSGLTAETHNGRKARVKGFLIRKKEEDRLNTTSVQVLAPTCR